MAWDSMSSKRRKTLKQQTEINSIGTYLRKLRKKCKLTIKEAAKQAKISSSFLS